jgi:hypothetical protein
VVTQAAGQTPARARPNRRRGAVLSDQDAAGRPLEDAGDGVPREMTVRSLVLLQNPAYRPGGSRTLQAFAAVLLAACAPQIPRQEPAPVAAAPAAEAPRVASWRIVPSLVAREYLIEQRAVILSTTDSGTFNDTTTVSTELSLRQTADGGASGLVRGVMLSSPGGVVAPFPGLPLPIAFGVPASSRGILGAPAMRPASGADPCRSPAEVPLGVIRELLVQLPDSVGIGTSWADSGSYRTCRDGAVLTVSTRRTFRLREFSVGRDEGTLTIERSSRTTLRGSATRGDDTTSVEGMGSGTMTLVVHARTGALLSGEGVGTLEITIRGRTKMERARQTLQSRIARRTP